MEKIRFKNDEEILQALIDNKKISCDGWKEHEYTHLKNGMLISDKGQRKCVLTSSFNEDYIWQPPKKYVEGKEVYKTLLENKKVLHCGNAFYMENGTIMVICDYKKTSESILVAKSFLYNLNVAISNGEKFEVIQEDE